MQQINPWEILGITPTDDKKTVKRAYAKLIKNHHPEDDPEGFQRVREAFETINAWIDNGYIQHQLENNKDQNDYKNESYKDTPSEDTQSHTNFTVNYSYNETENNSNQPVETLLVEDLLDLQKKEPDIYTRYFQHAENIISKLNTTGYDEPIKAFKEALKATKEDTLDARLIFEEAIIDALIKHNQFPKIFMQRVIKEFKWQDKIQVSKEYVLQSKINHLLVCYENAIEKEKESHRSNTQAHSSYYLNNSGSTDDEKDYSYRAEKRKEKKEFKISGWAALIIIVILIKGFVSLVQHSSNESFKEKYGTQTARDAFYKDIYGSQKTKPMGTKFNYGIGSNTDSKSHTYTPPYPPRDNNYTSSSEDETYSWKSSVSSLYNQPSKKDNDTKDTVSDKYQQNLSFGKWYPDTEESNFKRINSKLNNEIDEIISNKYKKNSILYSKHSTPAYSKKWQQENKKQVVPKEIKNNSYQSKYTNQRNMYNKKKYDVEKDPRFKGKDYYVTGYHWKKATSKLYTDNPAVTEDDNEIENPYYWKDAKSSLYSNGSGDVKANQEPDNTIKNLPKKRYKPAVEQNIDHHKSKKNLTENTYHIESEEGDSYQWKSSTSSLYANSPSPVKYKTDEQPIHKKVQQQIKQDEEEREKSAKSNLYRNGRKGKTSDYSWRTSRSNLYKDPPTSDAHQTSEPSKQELSEFKRYQKRVKEEKKRKEEARYRRSLFKNSPAQNTKNKYLRDKHDADSLDEVSLKKNAWGNSASKLYETSQ